MAEWGAVWYARNEPMLYSVLLVVVVNFMVKKNKGLVTYVEVVVLRAVLDVNMILTCFLISMEIIL